MHLLQHSVTVTKKHQGLAVFEKSLRLFVFSQRTIDLCTAGQILYYCTLLKIVLLFPYGNAIKMFNYEIIPEIDVKMSALDLENLTSHFIPLY